MKKVKLLLLFFIFSASFSFGQNWLWGGQAHMKDLKLISTISVATDANGNAFLAGPFHWEVSFGKDTVQDSMYAESDGAYYMKYNSAGNVQWVKQFFSPGNGCFASSVVTDASNNLIVAGGFDFNIKMGSYNYSTYGGDFFLAKCDNNGNILWTTVGVGENTNSVFYASTTSTALATDRSKNVFISGYFLDTLKFGATTLLNSNNTNYNIFTAKYDSNGNVLWAKQGTCITHTGGLTNKSYSVATDLNGNSFIAGSYNDSITFGKYTLTSPILYNYWMGQVFLVKYDPSGNVLWARQSNIPSAGNSAIGYGVTTDNAGNVYLTGAFTDTVSFGNHTLVGGGLFFVKYSANGNVIWAKSAGAPYPPNSAAYYTGYSLSSDEYNHIYLAGGGGRDSITFGKFTLNSPQNSEGNSFVIKFDTGGNAICGSLLFNGAKAYVSIATDKSGVYVYPASTIVSDTIFCAADTLTPPGEVPYVARWQNCGEQDGVPSISTLQKPSVLLYPNPSNGEFTIVESGKLNMENEKSNIEVYNMLGEIVYGATLKQVQGDNIINLSNQPNGIYLYRVITPTGNLIGQGKMIVQH
jgi:hypothetical protein